MKIIIHFERVPLHAVYEFKADVEESDIFRAVGIAAAELQASEDVTVKILSVSVDRTKRLVSGNSQCITKINESNGKPATIYLCDGKKITVGRDYKTTCGPAWLEISDQSVIKPAVT